MNCKTERQMYCKTERRVIAVGDSLVFYQVCQDLPRTGFNEMRSLTAPGHDFVVLEETKDADALTI